MKKTFKSILFATLGVFAFTCCEDVPAPYQIPGTEEKVPDKEIQPAGTGTLEDPYNVAGVVAFINTLQADTESEQAVYIKGKVASNTTTEETITKYGNMTFTMIDEGNKSTTFTAFQVYGPGKKKFTAVTDIKVGDEVVVYGKVVNYKGTTPETVGKGAAYVYSINSEGGSGEQTEGTPVTCAQAVELANALADGATSTETYTITGYITEVVGSVSKNQQTFWMADDKEGGKVFEAYWANLPEGVTAFVKGSKVKITGQLIKYVAKDGTVTPEIKNATVVILEAGEGGGGGTEEGTAVTCAQAVELTNALADGGTSTETYTITGYITEVIGNVSRNQQSFWMADEKDGGKVFEAYWANLPEGVTAFVKGSKVKITGQLIKYVKDGTVTPEIKNATVVILEAGEGGGGNEQGDTSEYGIALTYTSGTNFYDTGVGTINEVANCKVLKIGTSKNPGDFTLTVPAGKHSFYAVTWVGAGTADVTLKNGEETIKTVTIKENAGATGNSPYTITVTEADKYEFEVSTDCTVTVTSDKRVLFFGIK
ncbi:MAG: hypothetical protein J5524_09700 [Bacteroidaceae bacterium]|nr:hypothetical protein [Bacteroidaceae bacterium]